MITSLDGYLATVGKLDTLKKWVKDMEQTKSVMESIPLYVDVRLMARELASVSLPATGVVETTMGEFLPDLESTLEKMTEELEADIETYQNGHGVMFVADAKSQGLKPGYLPSGDYAALVFDSNIDEINQVLKLKDGPLKSGGASTSSFTDEGLRGVGEGSIFNVISREGRTYFIINSNPLAKAILKRYIIQKDAYSAAN